MRLLFGVALAVVAVNLLLCGIRAARGPTLFDRVVALDAIALNFAGAVLLVSLLLGTGAYLDLVVVLALVGFVSPIALAAYLEGTLVE